MNLLGIVQSVYEKAEKLSKTHGVTFRVQTPERKSSRFTACGICLDRFGLSIFGVKCDICRDWIHVNVLEEAEQQSVKNLIEKLKDELVWNYPNCNRNPRCE